MRQSRSEVGHRGEDLAVAELRRQGLEVVERNWRHREGEIDVVAVEEVDGRRTVVFCEVKCRTGLGFGHPLESVTYAKVRRLRRLAGLWLAADGRPCDAVRVDVIGVVLLPGAEPQLTHLRAVGL